MRTVSAPPVKSMRTTAVPPPPRAKSILGNMCRYPNRFLDNDRCCFNDSPETRTRPHGLCDFFEECEWEGKGRTYAECKAKEKERRRAQTEREATDESTAQE